MLRKKIFMLKINIKSEENVSAKKIAFWYVICNFITIAIGNLTTPIFARIMSTSDYGKFSNFMTWQNLLLRQAVQVRKDAIPV